MFITKIKIKDDETIIHYEKDSPGGAVESYTVSSPDAVHQDLIDAMNVMAESACKLLGFPLSYGENMKITGLTVSAGGEDLKAMVTALKELPCGVLVINTPLTSDLSQLFWAKIALAQMEAEDFVKGRKRAQMDLFIKPETQSVATVN